MTLALILLALALIPPISAGVLLWRHPTGAAALLWGISLIPPAWLILVAVIGTRDGREPGVGLLVTPLIISAVEVVALWMKWRSHSPRSAGRALAVAESALALQQWRSGHRLTAALLGVGALSQWRAASRAPSLAATEAELIPSAPQPSTAPASVTLRIDQDGRPLGAPRSIALADSHAIEPSDTGAKWHRQRTALLGGPLLSVTAVSLAIAVAASPSDSDASWPDDPAASEVSGLQIETLLRDMNQAPDALKDMDVDTIDCPDSRVYSVGDQARCSASWSSGDRGFTVTVQRPQGEWSLALTLDAGTNVDSASQAEDPARPVRPDKGLKQTSTSQTSTPSGSGTPDKQTASLRGAATCSNVADLSFRKGAQCAQAMAVVETCAPLGQLTFLFDTGGLAAWSYEGRSGDMTAYTSADPDQGILGVLSCGRPGSGLKVAEMHGAVAKAAQDGWGIEVESVGCYAQEGAVLDEVPPGPAASTCAVRDSNGFTSFAFVGSSSPCVGSGLAPR